jgi:hypothetical protein
MLSLLLTTLLRLRLAWLWHKLLPTRPKLLLPTHWFSAMLRLLRLKLPLALLITQAYRL